jgi:hypothetical protein
MVSDRIVEFLVGAIVTFIILTLLIFFIFWVADTFSEPIEKIVTLNGTEYQMYYLNNHTWIYCMKCEVAE